MNPNITNRVVDLAITVQQIPAPSLAEGKRALYIKQQFDANELQDVSIDAVGNVYGCLPGSRGSRLLVVSAHLDTVFPASTDLKIHREGNKVRGPGIGDNSLGVAGLFGLLWALRRGSELPGDVWLVANVGEEGLGDLCGMRAVVDRFDKTPLAYIILEGMALGQIYHRALGVRRYRIRVNTVGGHSWVDYGRPSAVHELATIITRLAALPLPEDPRTSLNVGVIRGGTSINTIAPEANLELDLRSEDSQTLKDLIKKAHDMVQETNRPEVKASWEVIGDRPAGELSPSHPLVRLAQHSLKSQGIQPNMAIGSTDANIPLSRGLPAVCLGVSTGYGAHTVNEYINTPPLIQGLAQLESVVRGVFQELA